MPKPGFNPNLGERGGVDEMVRWREMVEVGGKAEKNLSTRKYSAPSVLKKVTV